MISACFAFGAIRKANLQYISVSSFYNINKKPLHICTCFFLLCGVFISLPF